MEASTVGSLQKNSSQGKCDFLFASESTNTSSYIGIPVYLMLLFGYKFWKKTKGIKPEDADFYTGKDIIDKEEEEFLRQQALKGENAGKWGKMYDKTIGLVF